jgi:predicted small lipoprotein YifL
MLCFAAALPLAMAAACGQKGALYLPPRNGTVVTRPAGAAPETPAPAAAPGPTTPSSTPQTTNQPNQDDKKDNSQTPPK